MGILFYLALFIILKVNSTTADSWSIAMHHTLVWEHQFCVHQGWKIIISFVRWEKVLNHVLSNIRDNTGMILNIEGRVHWKDKSVTGNEHPVKRPPTVGVFCIHLHWGGWADSLISGYVGWLEPFVIGLVLTFRVTWLGDFCWVVHKKIHQFQFSKNMRFSDCWQYYC